MKRSVLVKYLQQHGCQLLREDVRHSVYWNPANSRTSTVPRHSEIDNMLARKICRDLDIPPP
jgi:predicted RNA binding protein YcfA (HicA-like mRNA interferase family)